MADLSLLIWWPILAGVISWFISKRSELACRWFTQLSVLITLIWLFIVPFVESQITWFSRFNIHFSVNLDGLSFLLITLTLLLTLLAISVSWQEIKDRVGFFHFNLMLTLAGINGVFLESDLFMFFFFWEAMLLPMTALIAIWGHENRRFAAIKFFIFTQASSLLMLISIIGLAYFHFRQFGQFSFDFNQLQSLSLSSTQEMWLMLGFFVAFAVKLPSIPFHTWLPDAHTQAPTAGSVLLAGILLKTGAYGLIRLILPLFPNASLEFAPVAATLGVISILYGALMAFSQSDFKRLVAYSSISHMGFILLAVYSWTEIGLNGAIVTMIAHGLSSAALFSLAGAMQFRVHSRDLNMMGGLWQSAPKMGVMVLIFVAAAVGIPGLANFVGEFLSLMGAVQTFPVLSAIAACGLIGSAIYGMHLFQSAFQGHPKRFIPDLNGREVAYTSFLVLSLLVLGLFPNHLLQVTEPTVKRLVLTHPETQTELAANNGGNNDH
mgnify:CR=1 FL=1